MKVTQSTLLVPLAGAGQRFADAGYVDPKPLVNVSGLPMIIQAARAMPQSQTKVFLCRKDHLVRYPLEKTLKQYYTDAQIITVEALTAGQASTCLLAEGAVPEANILHIGACDNSMAYHKNRFLEVFESSATDAVIWTFRGNPTVAINPKMYGWVDTDSTGRAKRVSCKVPISAEPLKDHAVVGAFSFRRAGDFFSDAKAMIAQNRRINNEFYVDECMNLLIEAGLKVRVFQVDHYICWGTPDDLRTFEYWQRFFDQHPNHPYKTKKDPNYVSN